MDAKTGLIIQFSGILLIAQLLFLLTQSLRSTTLQYWKKAWLCLTVALASMLLSFYFSDYSTILYFVYYFGEYLFGYFLILGCYNFTTGKFSSYRGWHFMVPSGLLALFLAVSVTYFNKIYYLHALIFGTVFVVAFFFLKPTNLAQKNLGWRLMKIALALLAVDFYLYATIFILDQRSFSLLLPTSYLAFSSLIDLTLEILLGFGMIVVLIERVRLEIEAANHKLKEAHEKLEQMVSVDPLTTAFSRHAFYGFVRRNGEAETNISGCVGFFDIDNLKPINDTYGHHVGDMVIRAVTCSIRSLMRAEDLIFRWGGDEFFVIMVSMEEAMARERMSRLTDLLTDIAVDGTDERLTIHVSFGFNDFKTPSELEKAIKLADEEMYREKQARKRKKGAKKQLAARTLFSSCLFV